MSSDEIRNLSEADTRAKRIDPAIHKRGWGEDLIRREETFVFSSNGFMFVEFDKFTGLKRNR